MQESFKEESDDNNSVDTYGNLGEKLLALEAKEKASAEEEQFEEELSALQVDLSKGKQRLKENASLTMKYACSYQIRGTQETATTRKG